MNAVSRFMEAVVLLRVAEYHETEIPVRIAQQVPEPRNPRNRAINSIKLGFAAAAQQLSRESFLETR